MNQRKIAGIVPPMVTPLTPRRTLDAEGTGRLVDHILKGGVNGIFLLGTSGEAPDLEFPIRCELVKRVCGQVAGRVPVLVGVTDTVFPESERLAAVAAEAGATALVAAPPYYYMPGQAELIDYYTDLADAMPLPLFLYNMPSHTKVMIEPTTVASLAAHKNIIGLKDSSANIVYFNTVQYELRERRSDFSILIGPEEALGEAVLMGADGGVSGGANLFPKLFVDMYNAARAKDVERVRELQQRVMAVSTSLYGVGHYASSFLKGVKCALSLMGICGDTLAEPFRAFLAPERARIEKSLGELMEAGAAE